MPLFFFLHLYFSYTFWVELKNYADDCPSLGSLLFVPPFWSCYCFFSSYFWGSSSSFSRTRTNQTDGRWSSTCRPLPTWRNHALFAAAALASFLFVLLLFDRGGRIDHRNSYPEQFFFFIYLFRPSGRFLFDKTKHTHTLLKFEGVFKVPNTQRVVVSFLFVFLTLMIHREGFRCISPW